MTTSQLIEIYMPLRKRLLDEGVPLDGWEVFISPQDAEDLELETKYPIGGQHVYGATWWIDATVPVGSLRIKTKEPGVGVSNR